MTKYTFLTILFTLLTGNIVSNNNQLHAQVPTPLFGEQHALTQSINNPKSVFAADLNGDGFADVLSASWSDNKIAWYANNGAGNFGAQQIITTIANGANSVYATDIDNDGDIDVLSASVGNTKIAWYANDGTGNFGTQQIISNNASYAASVYATDIDNDGDIDVLSASAFDDKIAWYANDGAGNFDEQQIITTNADYALSVYAADLDNDGDTDVLSASAGDDKIAWYANDGTGNFGEQQIITTIANGANSVYATDIDNDGDIDVLSASSGDNKIVWYANDGVGTFGTQQIITTNANYAQSVYAADIDNDGDIDMLSASAVDNKIAWYANDGAGNFGEQQIISTNADGANSVYAVDLDNDGDTDVLSASAVDNKIATYTNNGNATFSTEQIIIQATLINPKSLCTTDLDNNGFEDIIAIGQGPDQIKWFENNNDDVIDSLFSQVNFIIDDAWQNTLMYTDDIDNDNDIDILFNSTHYDIYGDDNKIISWIENDGNTHFNTVHTIYNFGSIGGNGYFSITDLNNDGSTDIILNSYYGLPNFCLNDGMGHFPFCQSIFIGNSYSHFISAADIDNDSYNDIIYANSGVNIIYWLKNNGNGTFDDNPRFIPNNNVAPSIICTTDVNNDGYIDLIYPNDTILYWIANNGEGVFSVPQIIATNVAVAQKIIANDVDNDGDNDIIVGSNYLDYTPLTTTNKIAWYANNGNGTFAPEEIITTNVNELKSIATADFDNDGDVDLASISYNDNKVAWYQNLLINSNGINPIINNSTTNPIFTLFPNPANKQVTLSLTAPINTNTTIVLTDLNGKTITIYNNPANNQTITINRQNLPNGLYFVQVQDANTNEVLGVNKVIFD